MSAISKGRVSKPREVIPAKDTAMHLYNVETPQKNERKAMHDSGGHPPLALLGFYHSEHAGSKCVHPPFSRPIEASRPCRCTNARMTSHLLTFCHAARRRRAELDPSKASVVAKVTGSVALAVGVNHAGWPTFSGCVEALYRWLAMLVVTEGGL